MPMILLIEDEQDLRENLVDTLTFEGYDLITAANGLQGIELAAAHEPDLILSDIMMPKMDGYSALVALQKDDKTAHIPVIFLSAANDRSYIRHGMELGAEDYLTKPFTHAELLSTIKARLQRNDVRESTSARPSARHAKIWLVALSMKCGRHWYHSTSSRKCSADNLSR